MRGDETPENGAQSRIAACQQKLQSRISTRIEADETPDLRGVQNCVWYNDGVRNSASAKRKQRNENRNKRAIIQSGNIPRRGARG